MKTPTQKQQYWLNHIQACQREAISMTAYAQRNDINIAQMYAWKSTLIKRGLLGNSTSNTATLPLFQKVTVAPAHMDGLHCKIILPNQLVLECSPDSDSSQIRRLVAELCTL